MGIRKYKALFQTYNFFKKDQLKHNLPLYKQYGLNKKYFSSISSEDFRGMESPLNKYDEVDSAVELPEEVDFQSLSGKEQAALLPWSQNGYAVLESFFSEEEIDACNKEIEDLLASGKVNFKYQNKIMFAFHQSRLLEGMGRNKKLLKILNLLMGKEVGLFQSINFLEGSQQRTHSDSIHMTTFPYGNLIAVWIALEDLTPECGPLHYYPGSHKLPYVMNRDYDNVGTKYKLGKKGYNDYEDQIEKVIQEKPAEQKGLCC